MKIKCNLYIGPDLFKTVLADQFNEKIEYGWTKPLEVKVHPESLHEAPEASRIAIFTFSYDRSTMEGLKYLLTGIRA